MTELTVQQIARTGLEATYVAATASGDEFDNDGKTFLHVVNGVTDVVVTLDIKKTVDGQDPTSPTVTCTANEERMIGPFPPSVYNDVDQHMNVTYDDDTNVTVAAIRLS